MVGVGKKVGYMVTITWKREFCVRTFNFKPHVPRIARGKKGKDWRQPESVNREKRMVKESDSARKVITTFST